MFWPNIHKGNSRTVAVISNILLFISLFFVYNPSCSCFKRNIIKIHYSVHYLLLLPDDEEEEEDVEEEEEEEDGLLEYELPELELLLPEYDEPLLLVPEYDEPLLLLL